MTRAGFQPVEGDVQVARYMPTHPRVRHRANVREPLDPRIEVRLIPLGHDLDGEMELTVQQALDLAAALVKAVQEKCQRRDIADALNRTEPLHV